MRKSFLVASVATLALGTAGIAYAQNPAPSINVTASASPSKAGTKKKPKGVQFKLNITNDQLSRTTADTIEITFPSTVKVSTKGLKQCTLGDQALLDNLSKCKKSFVGKGTANALLGPQNPTPGPLGFDIQPVIGKNEVLFVLSGAANAVLHGKISKNKMKITIVPELRQVGGVYTALKDIDVTLNSKKTSLISTVGCKSKKHTIGVKLHYVPNPTAPAADTASSTADIKCSK